jgi:signal transduction histidine kinase
MTELSESSTQGAGWQPVPAQPTSPSIPDAHDQMVELATALAARDHFIAYVSHELRNSLSPLRLLADQCGTLAADALARPTVASRAAMLSRTLERLLATITWVAELCDLRRGRLHLEPSAVDLTELVGEICRDLSADAEAWGAELVIEPGPPVAGSWDRARLKQLVTSLVSNAIRHAGGRIELRATASDGHAEFEVRDHGRGVDPVALPQLFELEPVRRRSGGFGIGLWMVKTLTAAMHGSVTAANCPDGGARFRVTLPRR